jgi:hypothetical protein
MTAYSAISWPESSFESSRKSLRNWEVIHCGSFAHKIEEEYTPPLAQWRSI